MVSAETVLVHLVVEVRFSADVDHLTAEECAARYVRFALDCAADTASDLPEDAGEAEGFEAIESAEVRE